MSKLHIPSQESLYQEWMEKNHPYTHVILNNGNSGGEGKGQSLLIVDKNYHPVATVNKLYTRGEYTPAARKALAKFPTPASTDFATEYLDAVQGIANEFTVHHFLTYLSRLEEYEDLLLPQRLTPEEYTQDPSSQRFLDFIYDVTNYRKGDAGKRQREMHKLYREAGIDVKDFTDPEAETIRIYTF